MVALTVPVPRTREWASGMRPLKMVLQKYNATKSQRNGPRWVTQGGGRLWGVTVPRGELILSPGRFLSRVHPPVRGHFHSTKQYKNKNKIFSIPCQPHHTPYTPRWSQGTSHRLSSTRTSARWPIRGNSERNGGLPPPLLLPTPPPSLYPFNSRGSWPTASPPAAPRICRPAR